MLKICLEKIFLKILILRWLVILMIEDLYLIQPHEESDDTMLGRVPLDLVPHRGVTFLISCLVVEYFVLLSI